MKTFLMLYFFILYLNKCISQLRGNAILCSDRDGTSIDIKQISGGAITKPCVKCTCQSGYVNCSIDDCPQLNTCPLAEKQQQNSETCCPKCRTCNYLGTHRINNERWKSVQDPCYSLTCKGGIVSSSRMQCNNHCKDGLHVPGYCCQLCKKKPPNINSDLCLHCDSVMGIWYHCYRLACPVLDCPVHLIRHDNIEQKCCPECLHPSTREYRTALSENPRVQGYCTFRLRRYELNEIFHVDPCTRCHCQSGGVTCRRFTCPIRQCHTSAKLLFRKNVCCPFCQYSVTLITTTTTTTKANDDDIEFETTNLTNYGEFRSENNNNRIDKFPLTLKTNNNNGGGGGNKSKITTCIYKLPNGTLSVRKHDSYWKASNCLNCRCRNGKTKCEKENCYPKEPFQCSKGSRKVKLAGNCCPFCEQYESTCTVFGGDPHYETFDGLDYSFHGNKSYVLAQECGFDDDDFESEEQQPDFVVIAHNFKSEKIGGGGGGVHTGRISIILRTQNSQRSLVLQMTQDKLFIENDRPIQIPKNTSIYSINQNESGHLHLIIPILGLKITFDGRGFAELTLSIMHKGKVCGLCGNYNDDSKDDLWPKYSMAATDNIEQFATSWKWKTVRASPRCETKTLTAQKFEELAKCRTLLENKFFSFCRKQIHVHGYLKQCIRDVCECKKPTNATNNEKPCFCNAIESFATQCANRFVWGQYGQILQNVRQFPVHPECNKIRKPNI